ncbi:MAG: hypothetical protein V7642_710 [Burkholderiales bacterium]
MGSTCIKTPLSSYLAFAVPQSYGAFFAYNFPWEGW